MMMMRLGSLGEQLWQRGKCRRGPAIFDVEHGNVGVVDAFELVHRVKPGGAATLRPPCPVRLRSSGRSIRE